MDCEKVRYCPNCGEDWRGKTVIEGLREHYPDRSDKELADMAKDYDSGHYWKMIGVEYTFGAEHYDGVSEYQCPACEARYGRWTGKLIPKGFIEPRFGRGGEPITAEEV